MDTLGDSYILIPQDFGMIQQNRKGYKTKGEPTSRRHPSLNLNAKTKSKQKTQIMIIFYFFLFSSFLLSPPLINSRANFPSARLYL